MPTAVLDLLVLTDTQSVTGAHRDCRRGVCVLLLSKAQLGPKPPRPPSRRQKAGRNDPLILEQLAEPTRGLQRLQAHPCAHTSPPSLVNS